MAAAIANFEQIEKESKIAILGDMFELGEESLNEHKNIVELLQNTLKTTTHFVGKDFYFNKIKNEKMYFHKDFEELSNYLKENKIENSFILIKGSRGMSLERVLEII